MGMDIQRNEPSEDSFFAGLCNRLSDEEQDVLTKKIHANQYRTQLLNKQLDEYYQRIRSLCTEIDNLKTQVDQLNRHILMIHTSSVFKHNERFNRFFPIGGRKRALISHAYHLIRHPVLSTKHLHFSNLRSFCSYMATGEKKYAVTTGKKGHLIFPIEDKPVVSIIIPVHDQWDYTYNCLKSILDNSADVRYEVIVADDCSDDRTTKIEDYTQNIHILHNQQNTGFLLNCNRAAETAHGKYICFLNNDTIVTKNWLSSLVQLLEANSEIGLAGSKLLYPDGVLQEAGGIIWNDGDGWNYGRMDNPEKPEYNYLRETDYVSGASIIIRSALWKTIGGFDERFAPAYYEDTDLAFEVRKHGFKVVYQPLSVVFHYEGMSNGRNPSEGIKKFQAANHAKFYEKWKDVLIRDHVNNSENLFLARDRSVHKKTLLIIDHYVPEYDRDAGSKNTFFYVQTAARMGYNVKFLGDNFAHKEPYTTVLEQMGVEVLYGEWCAENLRLWMTVNGQFIDYVLVNRPNIAVKYIEMVKQFTHAKIVYHGQDLHFIREKAEYDLTRNEDLLPVIEMHKQQEFYCIEMSDAIVTVSEKEKNIIKREFPYKQAEVIPIFCFDEFLKPDMDRIRKSKGLMFVGGFNHTPNVDGTLWFVREVLDKIDLPGIKCTIVGSNPPKEILDLASERVEIKGFVSEEELKNLYLSARIVVIPLRYGSGVKGKTIEAMHYLTPIVSTSFGIEGLEDIEPYIDSYDEADRFAEEIKRLYLQEEALYKTAQKYDHYIRKYYSTQTAINKMSHLFEL